MKKKLLLILTTILLAVTTFTSNVFGDDNTVGDLFTNYGAYLLNLSNSYSNGNASLHIIDDSSDLYIGFDYDSDDEYAMTNYTIDNINVTQATDPSVYTASTTDYWSGDSLEFEFTINGYEITSIKVSGFPETAINGTYVSPVPHKTVADILDTVDGGYPVSADDVTVPEGCWTTLDGYRLYYTNDKSQLLVSDTPLLTIDSNMVLTSDSDGNYKAVIPFIFNIYVKFVMNNNKLKKIEVSAPDIETEYLFEPVGNNRVTLDTLFWDLDVVPSSQDKAWVNENGAHIYIDDDDHIFYAELNNYIYSSFLCLNKPSYSNNILFYYGIPSTITATLSNNKIQSLKINMSDADIDAACELYAYDDTEKGLFKKARGTYAKVTTISDILPDDFPQSIQAGFINENGKRAYKDTMSSLKVGSVSLGLNNAVTKVGNDYSYTYPMSPNQTYLFKITNGKVSSIVVSGCSDSSEDGTYSSFGIIEQTSSCNVGYNGEVKIRLNAYFPDTSGTKVYVDGVEKTEGTDYDREQGSLIITFKSSFISTLSVSAGSHPFKINVPNYPEINGNITFSNPSSGGGGSSGHVVLNTGVSSFLKNK